MSAYEAVIGLEVHAQLKTATKIFCSCSTRFGDSPNENTCPVCTGMPGVLPVLNARAVEYAARMGLAVDCTVNSASVFARKNYFYPDLPKGYQISQYEKPLAEHGRVEIEVDGEVSRVGVTRIHMEEDAGKSVHSAIEDKSYVDLNRTGVPLIEIVSEPDMRSADQAVAYLKQLHDILVYLDICDGNMEEGSFRCDANISLRRKGEIALGVRAEIKNLNSFRNVHRALTYEISRQEELLDDGEEVVQETRLFDADKGVTRSMRGKEEAHDYRYFPDPDLVPLVLDPAQLAAWRDALPELPADRRKRFAAEYSLPGYDAGVLTADRKLADYFEAVTALGVAPKTAGNWIMSDLLREMNIAGLSMELCPMSPQRLAELIKLVEQNVISLTAAKKVFSATFSSGEAPEEYVREHGLAQISDHSALEEEVDRILAAHPEEVAAFRNGKTKLMGFFVGQVMRATKGKGNPQLVNDILRARLG